MELKGPYHFIGQIIDFENCMFFSIKRPFFVGGGHGQPYLFQLNIVPILRRQERVIGFNWIRYKIFLPFVPVRTVDF